MPAVFISQEMLQVWTDEGKVSLEGNTLYLTKEDKQIEMLSAVRVTGLLGTEEDPHGLVGKVKSVEQIAELGAEHYRDSLIFEDTAYSVVEGFLGDLTKAEKSPPKDAEAQALPAEPEVRPEPVEHTNRRSAALSIPPAEAEALSDLFLETVR